MEWEKVMMRCLRLLILIGYLGIELYVFVDWLTKAHHSALVPVVWRGKYLNVCVGL